MEAGYGFNPSLSLWLHMLPPKFVGMQKYFRIIFCRIWNLISHVLLLCDKFLQSSGLTFFIRRPYKFFGRMVLSWTESSFSILQTPQIWSWKHLKIFFFFYFKVFHQLVVPWTHLFYIPGKWKMQYHHSCFHPYYLGLFWLWQY